MGFNIILSSTPRYSFGLFPSGVSTTDLYLFFSSPIRATCSAHHTLRSLFVLAISDAHASSACHHLLFALTQLWRCFSLYVGRTCIICTRNWYRRLFNFHKYGNPLYIGPHLDPLSELWEETHDTIALPTSPLPLSIPNSSTKGRSGFTNTLMFVLSCL